MTRPGCAEGAARPGPVPEEALRRAFTRADAFVLILDVNAVGCLASDGSTMSRVPRGIAAAFLETRGVTVLEDVDARERMRDLRWRLVPRLRVRWSLPKRPAPMVRGALPRDRRRGVESSAVYEHLGEALDAARWARPGLSRAIDHLSSAIGGTLASAVGGMALAPDVAEESLSEARRALSRSRKHVADFEHALARLGYAPVEELRVILGPDLASRAGVLADLAFRRAVREERETVEAALRSLDDLVAHLRAWREAVAGELSSETVAAIDARRAVATDVPRRLRPPRAAAPRGRSRPWLPLAVGAVILAIALVVVIRSSGEGRRRRGPPLLPTLERFEAVWAQNRFLDLRAFVKEENNARLWRQFEKAFRARGWDVELPPLWNRRQASRGGGESVTWRTPEGDLRITWVLEGEGCWAIGGAKLPKR